MPKPSLFANKVFYRVRRKEATSSEKALLQSILSKHDLDIDFIYTRILIDDLFSTTYHLGAKEKALIIRTSFNHGTWETGDAMAEFYGDTCNVFFNNIANGSHDDIEYAIFQAFGPMDLEMSNPEERIILSRFLGGAQHELSSRECPLDLPPLISAYDSFFDLCSIKDHIPSGSEKAFKKTSPISIEELDEFLSILREDFIETLNSLPDPPVFLFKPCFGPLDRNYVFYDPFLRFLPPMFPYQGNPLIDMAVNCNLLLLSNKEASKVFSVQYEQANEISRYVSYAASELWHPAIVPQFINRLISYSFSGFPNKSIINSTNLYNVLCRNKIFNFNKYKKISKKVDAFFLNDIIY